MVRAPIGARSGMTVANVWLARLEHFDVVESTNDIVAGWLQAGSDEVCVAVANEQTAGRGRNGRSWTAPRDAALLCSIGFRPRYLDASRLWQLAAIVSLAMADAAETVSGATAGTVRLKWPNDLVVANRDANGDAARKLAGVLGETAGAGTDDPRVVIGIGVNAGWQRADFPPDLQGAMTSVAELSDAAQPSGVAALPAAAPPARSTEAPASHSYAGDTHRQGPTSSRVLRNALLHDFLERLEPLVNDLQLGRFPAQEWRDRQLTRGTVVRLERPDGSAVHVRAVDVDAESGALVVESLSGEWPARSVTVGEISHLRLAEV